MKKFILFGVMFIVYHVSADCIIECDQQLASVARRSAIVSACVKSESVGYENKIDPSSCDYFVYTYQRAAYVLRKMEEECSRQINKK